MPRSHWASAPQLLSLRSRAHEPQLLSPRATITEARVPTARAPQWEKPPRWEARAPQRRVAPHLPQLGKAQAQQRRPNAAKTRLKEKKQIWSWNASRNLYLRSWRQDRWSSRRGGDWEYVIVVHTPVSSASLVFSSVWLTKMLFVLCSRVREIPATWHTDVQLWAKVSTNTISSLQSPSMCFPWNTECCMSVCRSLILGASAAEAEGAPITLEIKYWLTQADAA